MGYFPVHILPGTLVIKGPCSMAITGPRRLRTTSIGVSESKIGVSENRGIVLSHVTSRLHEFIPGPRPFQRRFVG